MLLKKRKPMQTVERILWLNGIRFERVKVKGQRTFYRDIGRQLFQIFVPVDGHPRLRTWLVVGPDRIVETFPRGHGGRYEALLFAANYLKRHHQ